MKFVLLTFGLAVALGGIGTTASAEDLEPLAGHSIGVGAMRGIVYYRVNDAGFEVVITLAEQEGGAPIRYVTALRPGQSMLVSTPGPIGAKTSTVTFRREGDRLVLDENRARAWPDETVGERILSDERHR
jgi:hypothetical protein